MKSIKLSEICEIITKGTTPTTLGYEFQSNGVNFIKIESLTNTHTFFNNKFDHISIECNNSLKRSILKENDILFSIAGAIGKTAIVTNDVLPANTNQALAIVRVKYNVINIKYLLLILSSNVALKQLEGKKHGVAQINVSLKNIGDLIIPLPDNKIQTEIVEKFELVQNIISKQKEQIVKLDELVKSRFVEMFGEPLSSCKYGRITLDKLVKVNQGLQIPISKRFNEDGNNRYKYITIQYLHGGKNEEYIENPKESVICKKDDILMTRTGNTGQVITGVEGVFHNNFFKVNYDKEKINKIFLIKYFESDSIYRDMLKRATTSTIPDLSHSEFYKMSIDLPPIELQNEFANFVEQIDKLKFVYKKQLENTIELQNSLMQKYFD